MQTIDNNEKAFIDKILNVDYNISKAQEYIKENFNIDSIYNEEDCELKLIRKNINESLQLASAKEYIEGIEELEGFINVSYE